MSVEIPACPERGGFAVFFDAQGNVEKVFAYKKINDEKSCLVKIKNSISKEEFLKKDEKIKLDTWGSGILPMEVESSPGRWAVIDGQRIWVP